MLNLNTAVYDPVNKLGDSAILFFEGTRWNCTENLWPGLGEIALFKLLYFSENHRDHRDFEECSFTLSLLEISAVSSSPCL